MTVSSKSASKAVSFVLAIALIVSAFAAALAFPSRAFDEVRYGDFIFYTDEFDGAKTAILQKYTGTAPNVVVPSQIKEYSVTGLAPECFCQNTAIKSVSLPDTVLWIGDKAFYRCSRLESVSGAGKLISIASFAFYECEKLKKAPIPSTVGFIDEQAFYGCASLTSVTIPDGVEAMRYDTFRKCASLKSVKVGKGAKGLITSGSLAECASLERVEIVEGNPDFCSYDGAVYTADGKTLLFCPLARSEIAFKPGVTSIGYRAFADHTLLLKAAIPDSVTLINQEAFENCAALAEVTLPCSITDIRSGTFRDCVSLGYVDVPEGVAVIATDAFWGCASLKEITLPKSLREISSGAFFGTALSEVNYRSSGGDWKKIDIKKDSNEPLFAAKINCDFKTDTPGDVNRDGKLNGRDVTALMKAIVNGTAASAPNADFNGDGKVNAKDVTALMKKRVAK